MKFQICATSLYIAPTWSETGDRVVRIKKLQEFLSQLPGDDKTGRIIEINTLEDLAKLQRELDNDLIIDFRDAEFPTIEIYNDYRE